MTPRAERLVCEIADLTRRIEWCHQMIAELEADGVSLERIDEIMAGVPAECQ